jgi:HD-GYP domain-containing protein (c-di-GMP phosphodiesterase class II)
MNLEKKVKEQTDVINSMYVRSIDSLIKALEAKDYYTRGHSQRVTIYCLAVAAELGLPEGDRDSLRRARCCTTSGRSASGRRF